MPGPAIDPQRVEQARALYDAGSGPVSEVAAMLGLGSAAFYKWRLKAGWPMRTPIAIPRKHPKRKSPTPRSSPPRKRAPAPPFDEGAVTEKIEAALEQGLAVAADDLGCTTTADAERNARMLASLSKALAELRKLQTQKNGRNRKGTDGHVERPARDMATLRADIARRLEQALRPRSDPGPADEPER